MSFKNERLNVSVGAFQIGFVSVFDVVDGVVIPTRQATREMLNDFMNFGNFEVTVKIADDKIEQLTDSGYGVGIMNMMKRDEIDVTWIPLPMDTPNISGVFSQVVYEDDYRLASYYRPTISIMQDIIHTFTLFDPKIWIITLLLIYISECLLDFKDPSLRSIRHSLINCIQRLPSLVFKQYFAKRSMIRSIQMIGLLFLTIIFGASFNKDMIIGTSQETVNTLRDVVNQRKTPIFLDGLSEYELFRLGVTSDFREVYKLANEKGKTDYFALVDLFSRFTPEYVILTSTKIRRIIDAIDYLVRSDRRLILHWSEQVYHKVHQAYVITSNPVKVKVKNRLMIMIYRLQQSHIFEAFLERVTTELCMDFNLPLHMMFRLRYRGSKINTSNGKRFYSPLSSAGFTSIRSYYCIFISLAGSIFIIECVLSIIISTNWTKFM